MVDNVVKFPERTVKTDRIKEKEYKVPQSVSDSLVLAMGLELDQVIIIGVDKNDGFSVIAQVSNFDDAFEMLNAAGDVLGEGLSSGQ
jgi:hypothetical protein